jgi:hypothetical protein
MEQLVCVLVPFFKNVSFFCGDCGGCGKKGTLQMACFRCRGEGIRTERILALKFGGVGKIRDCFGDGADAIYTVVQPQIWDVREDNPRRTMDVSSAYWDQVSKLISGTAYNTITTQVRANHIFATYGDALGHLPHEKEVFIKAEILKIGGDPDVFQEDPEKIPPQNIKTTDPRLQKRKTDKSVLDIVKGDFVTAVVYRGSVLRYFKCHKCDGTVVSCNVCYGGGKDGLYVPQYIVEGVVMVTKVISQYVEYLVPPILYVNDPKHVVNTANYWHDGFGADNAPKPSQGTMDFIFTTSKAALDWLETKNREILLYWAHVNKRVPFDADGHLILDVPVDSAPQGKFPEPVAIEACLK